VTGLGYAVQIQGSEEARFMLMRFADRGENMQPALEAIQRDFFDMEQHQFTSQGAFRSGGWAELADSTVAYKERNDLDPRILYATHRLVQSLTGESGENYAQFTREGVALGSTVPYAGFHQTGTTRMPRRPLLELTDADVQRWAKIVQTWLVTGRRGSSSW